MIKSVLGLLAIIAIIVVIQILNVVVMMFGWGVYPHSWIVIIGGMVMTMVMYALAQIVATLANAKREA